MEYLNMIDDDIKWKTEGEVQQEIEVEDMEKKVERCPAFLDTHLHMVSSSFTTDRVSRKARHLLFVVWVSFLNLQRPVLKLRQ